MAANFQGLSPPQGVTVSIRIDVRRRLISRRLWPDSGLPSSSRKRLPASCAESAGFERRGAALLVGACRVDLP